MEMFCWFLLIVSGLGIVPLCKLNNNHYLPNWITFILIGDVLLFFTAMIGLIKVYIK